MVATSGLARVIDFVGTTRTACRPRSLASSTTRNRTARIALLHYADGEKRYIVAPTRFKQGDIVVSGPGSDIRPGNCLPLRNIPTGTVVHAIELKPGGGAKIARSAGSSVQLVAKDGPYALLRMPSGETRNVDQRCRATVGEVGNAEQGGINWGKAGRMRWKGQAPARPRCCHEPGRPPAWWWRGQDLRWPPPGRPAGQPKGRPRPEQAQRAS